MVDVIQQIINDLKHIYSVREARNIALDVVQQVTKWPRIQILSGSSLKLTEEQGSLLKSFVERLKRNEPIQYVLGTAEFFGLTLKVDKRVLIPRPETEELVEWVLKDSKKESRIIDLCTGSGCIAIALAKHLPEARISAYDLSVEALELARENGTQNNVDVDFFQADILVDDFAEHIPEMDIIVSNPPYVLEREKRQMQQNVLDFEPSMALFVPDTNPMLFYEAIARIASSKLKSGGALFVEINQTFGKETISLFENKGFCHVRLNNDLYGNARMVKAERC